MAVQDHLARVPLCISFPTLILSCTLIVTPRRVSVPDIESQVLNVVLEWILVPLYAACTYAFVSSIYHGSVSHLVGAQVATGVIIAHITNTLEPVESTCVSLAIVKCLSLRSTARVRTFWRVILPLAAVAVTISFIQSGTSLILRHSVCLIETSILLNWHRISAKVPFFSVVSRTSLGLLASGALVSMYFCSLLISECHLQILMVLVFTGCMLVFCFSLQDIITVTTCSLDCSMAAYAHWVSPYTALGSGIMAIFLDYLSFSVVSKTWMGTFCTLVFILTSEWLLSRIDDRDLHNCGTETQDQTGAEMVNEHEHIHSEKGSHESVLRQVALNKDTRSIFSFLLLNTTFMFVQLLYSFRSRSLGLLSDSLHMALDCTSLLLGLIAGVLSKKPVSDKFPFALGYLETLAGFTNGVLLLGIVCGIFVEAIGRLIHPVHLHGTSELLIVATLGLFVNLVGLFAFDHGGHSHGDSSNENMRGIFLHILADTLGSVGVVISTVLIKLTKLPIFDPIASLAIGFLILLSAVPLLKSTASKLLLKLHDRDHNQVKLALNQISTAPGISGYTTPRFWLSQVSTAGHSHAHSHKHSEPESYSQTSTHSHSHENLAGSKESESKSKLIGFIHIQVIDGENSTIVKKRVEKIFHDAGIKAWIQVEPTDSQCWCRSNQQKIVPGWIPKQ